MFFAFNDFRQVASQKVMAKAPVTVSEELRIFSYAESETVTETGAFAMSLRST